MDCLRSFIESQRKVGIYVTLLVAVLTSGIFVSSLWAQQGTPSQQSAPARKTSAPAVANTAATQHPAKTPVTYRRSMPRRAVEYYGIFWGIDSLSVKEAESGELIRFHWRVLDAKKASSLNDEKLEPYLLDPAAKAKLVVPELPFMGKMRVKSTPEAGRTDWVAFSNAGHVVKKGDRVSIVIGQFRADGLIVE